MCLSWFHSLSKREALLWNWACCFCSKSSGQRCHTDAAMFCHHSAWQIGPAKHALWSGKQVSGNSVHCDNYSNSIRTSPSPSPAIISTKNLCLLIISFSSCVPRRISTWLMSRWRGASICICLSVIEGRPWSFLPCGNQFRLNEEALLLLPL